ncbi:MAG: hypothetical protein HS124_06760 [Anaerolineales bacterium]|nr:hypothetical protein [Anaerolineales bacterium]
MKRISGVDLSVVDGFGVSLAQTVIMEVGTDMRQVSERSISVRGWDWRRSTKSQETKVLKNKTLKTKNRAGKPFGWRRQSVKQADSNVWVAVSTLEVAAG